MAKQRKKLAKPTASGKAQLSGPQLHCESLLVQRGNAERAYRVRLHSHPFWQVDIATSRGFEAETGETLFDLRPGDLVVVPPRLAHGFLYPAGAAYLTFKFYVQGVVEQEPWQGGDEPALQAIRAALEAMVPETGEPSPEATRITEHLLAALLLTHSRVQGERDGPSEARFVQAIKAYVQEQGGRYVTVADVAAHMHRSASHTASCFRQATGQSLKSWLDQQRSKVCQSLLEYSDMSISQIAEYLGFADLYSFSRFFKRLTRKSPRQFRTDIYL